MLAMTLNGLATTENALALLTLTGLEIVLGIDNIIFIAILVGRLPESQRKRARLVGLGLAMFMRIVLLLGITQLMQWDKHTLFHLPLADHDMTGKDLVLLIGGLFLVGKSVLEIHHQMEATERPEGSEAKLGLGFAIAIVQIILLDIVFSLDSVITAVGMAQRIEVMIAAVVIAVIVMMAFSGYIARFVEKHPSLKMLALAFLILIGVVLVGEGCGQHVSKGYIYFAMAFALGVEMLNIRLKRSREVEQA